MKQMYMLPIEPTYTVADIKYFIHYKGGPDAFPLGSIDVALVENFEINVLGDDYTMEYLAKRVYGDTCTLTVSRGVATFLFFRRHARARRRRASARSPSRSTGASASTTRSTSSGSPRSTRRAAGVFFFFPSPRRPDAPRARAGPTPSRARARTRRRGPRRPAPRWHRT